MQQKKWLIDASIQKKPFAAHIDDVARRFVQIVNTGAEMPAIVAGKEILERVEGKVKDQVEHGGTVGVAVVDVLKAIEKVEDEQQRNRENIPEQD